MKVRLTKKGEIACTTEGEAPERREGDVFEVVPIQWSGGTWYETSTELFTPEEVEPCE